MKKLLLGIIAVFMSLGLACGSCFLIENFTTPNAETEQTDDEETKAMTSGYWSDYANTTRPYGSGTASDPYQIGDAVTLASFAYMVNNNYKNGDTGLLYQESNVILTADINLSAHYWTPIGSGAYETTSGWWIFSSSTWHPYYFSGTFNGNGHTISGMYINASGASGLTSSYVSGHPFDYGDTTVDFNYSNSVTVGFFGFTKGATIKNLTLTNGSIVITSSSEGSNQSLWCHVGAVVGLHAGGSIYNVTNDGVNIGYYQYSGHKATAARSLKIGGVVGLCVDSATIKYAFSRGKINVQFYGNGAKFYELGVSGIVGTTTYDVSYSSSEMNILIQSQSSGEIASYGMSVSGIIGLLRSTKGYTWCYENVFNGTITTDLGPGSLINSVGGIISNLLNMSTNDAYKVWNCINYGKIIVKNVYNTYVGGIVAVNQLRAIRIYKCINFGDFDLKSNTTDNGTGIGYGGILGAGSNSGTYIYDCANYGDVIMTGSKAVYNIGGIAGFILNNGLVTRCINHGKIGKVGQKLGGIVGRTGQPEEKARVLYILWEITTQEEMSNVYITNCINYGPVSGGDYYGQIAGHMIGGPDRVKSCYTRSDFPSGATSTTWAIGNESSTAAADFGGYKKYDIITSCTGTGVFAKKANWTTDKLGGYSSLVFETPRNGHYSPSNSYTWYTTALVYNYYNDSQKNNKAMSCEYIIVPSFAVHSANAYVLWNKRSGTYTIDSNSEVGTVEVRLYDTNKNNIDWVKSDTVYYLNGADYNNSSYSDRYKNLLRVTYKDEKFTFTKAAYKIGADSEVTMSNISNGKTYYARFKNYNDNNLSLRYYFASKSVKSVDVNYFDADNNNKAVTDGSIGNATVKYPNYDYYDISSSNPLYFKDTVYYTITPTLGYAFKSLSVNSGESDETSIANNHDDTKGFTTLGKVQGYMTYDFQTEYNFYMKKIAYSYNVNVLGKANGEGSFVKGNTLSFTVLDCLGYEYTIYLCKYTTSKSNVNLDKSSKIVTTEATLTSTEDYNGVITLSSDSILTALSEMATKEGLVDIELSQFSLYVVKTEIEYTINIHNMINKYDQLDYYQEVTDSNYKTLIDSNMTEYDMTQFSTFVVGNTNSLSIKTSVSDGFKIKYTDAKTYGFCVGSRYSNFKTGTSLPSSSIFSFELNDSVATIVNSTNFKLFLLSYKQNVANTSKTIDIFLYYQLGGYDLQGKAEKDGNEINIPTNVFDLKGSSKQRNKNANETTISYDNIFVAKYYAPITLRVNSLSSNQNFAGWYIRVKEGTTLKDKLLSTNKVYCFINNPQVATANMIDNKLIIVAKFLTYDESEHAIENSKGIYQVSSAQDLLWLSERVNAGFSFEGMTITQTCDIDMSGVVFNSIGTETASFKGVYDGNNFIVSNLNLTINKNSDTKFMNNLSNRGLFGYVKNATIKNLTISNGSVSGYGNVGMIAGYAENTKFEYVNTYKSTVNVSQLQYYDIYGRLVDSYLTSGATSTEKFTQRENVGGLVGYAKGCEFYASSNRASVQDVSSVEVSGVENAGGFVGRLEDNGSVYSEINQCFNEGTVSMASAFNGFANWYQDVNGTKTKTALIENTRIKDCYTTYPSMTIINATYVNSKLDTSIWMSLNGRNTLRAFYWN